LESEDYLIQLLKLAKEAGASPEVIENINKRIVVKQNRTDSSYMSVYNAMRKFEPFSNLTPELKQNIVLSLPDSSPQKALLLNFKEITEDIVANEPAFLLLDYNRQKQIIQERAEMFASMAVSQNSVRQIRNKGIQYARRGTRNRIKYAAKYNRLKKNCTGAVFIFEGGRVWLNGKNKNSRT
jgi:hypothetical protein